MLRLFTIVAFSLFVSSTLSAEYVDFGCNKKGCTEYEWYNKGRFNPLSIHWPLHYTGEVYKDTRDGGAHDIEVIYGGHGSSYNQHTLSYYRRQPECPSPTYLSQGVKMHDEFECVNEAYDKPTWDNSSCSDIFSSYEDTRVEVDGPACSKIIREWTLVDWCQYKPNTRTNTYQDRFILVHDTYKDKAYFTYGRGKSDVEHDGWYSFKQVIKIVDKHDPEMVSCEDVTVEITDGKCAAYVKLRNKIVDSGPCAGENMTVEATIKDYSGNIVTSKWVNAKHDKYFDTTVGYLDAGHYTVSWKFKDGCGNSNTCTQKISVEDKSTPHMLCIKDLSTSISDKYGTSIWAEDFAFKVTGSCDPEDVSVTFQEDEFVPSLDFDCSDELGFVDLTVYAIDGNGNSASCNVELFIADHNACGDENEMQIAGKVFDTDYIALEDVNIEVVKGEEVLSSVMSNNLGRYNLSGIPTTKSTTVLKPTKEDDSLDGLDANDLLYLLRHITRVERFDDILEYAAADLNSDALITLDDYWLLAGKIYNLPNTEEFEAWKFFDENMLAGQSRASKLVVPIPVKTFKHRYDIMGLKVGDIDFSLLDRKKAKWRSTQQLASNYTITNVGVGQMLSFDMKDLNEVGSITFTFENIGQDLVSSVTSEGEVLPYISRVEGSDLLVTVMDADGFDGSLELTTQQRIELSSVSSAIEVSGKSELIPASIEWTKIEEGTVELSAAPNPFNEMIRVNYVTSANETAEVEVININGQTMLNQEVEVVPGLNELTLNTQELNSGIYLIKVSTANSTEIMRVTKNR